MKKENKKEYGIAAYNFRTKMVEVLPYVFTSKLKAKMIAEQMKNLGAKKVKIV